VEGPDATTLTQTLRAWRDGLRPVSVPRYNPLGIAATGVVVYFIGAVGTHLRKRDVKGLPNALAMLILAAAALTLRALSW